MADDWPGALIPLDPVDIRFLGLTAIVTGANGVADPIEQARLRIRRRRRLGTASMIDDSAVVPMEARKLYADCHQKLT